MKSIFLITILLFEYQSCVEKKGGGLNDKYYNDNEKIAPFYSYDSTTNRFTLCNILNSHILQNEEKEMNIKENVFKDEFLVLKRDTLFLIDSFYKNNIMFKIFIYTLNLDNDINMLNIQLNSYEENKCIDAILLNQVLNNETLYFSNFIIKSNNIYITKYQIEYTEYDEDGDIVGIKAHNDTLKYKVKYKIMEDGYFKKIK